MNTNLIIFLCCVGVLSGVHAFRLSHMHSLSVLTEGQASLRLVPGNHPNKRYQAVENMVSSTWKHLSKHMNKTATKNEKTSLLSNRTHSILMLQALRKHVTHQPFFACWAHVERHSLDLSKEYVIVFLFCVGLLSCVHAFRLYDMHSLSSLIQCQTGLQVAPGKHSNRCYRAREKTATSTRHILTIPENMFPCSP
jgi:hypothetical protein